MDEETYDAIVVGSGIGGMAAAAMLARLRNKRVLVLERHTELGGLTHEFRREGYSWDVGLHYVGEMDTGYLIRRFMDFITGGALAWNRLPEDFERFIYPNLRFDVPADPELYEQRLTARFPKEKKAIRRYFRDIRVFSSWHSRDFVSRYAPRFIGLVLKIMNVSGRSTAVSSTESYMKKNFRTVELRRLLVSQWGNYGLPPSESAFAVHALIVCHYLHGAWFPDGGAGRIAGFIEKVIEAHGGSCFVGWEATKILVDGTRVCGVEARERFGQGRRVIQAPVVISDIGIAETCERLLGFWPEERLRSRVSFVGHGYSAVTLYVGLSRSPASLGIKGENFWIFENPDHEDVEGASRSLMEGKAQNTYISFPSLKKHSGSQETIKHTVEIISMVPSELFSRWSETGLENRGVEYRALKERISEGLLALAERHIPGIRGLVAYSELSTPLSVTYYTGHPRGEFYGIPARPQRYQSGGFSPRSTLKGLYFAGSDVSALGVAGSMMGGIAAACLAMGRGGFGSTFMSTLPDAVTSRSGTASLPAGVPAVPPSGQHLFGHILSRTEVTPSVFELRIAVEHPGGTSTGTTGLSHEAGQFVKLRVAETEWREYSIVEAEGRTLTLLIAARMDGSGPRFARSARQGDAVDILMPFGSFVLFPGERRKVFIATGTGLAPMVAQIASLARSRFARTVELYYGCRGRDDDLTPRYLAKYRDSLDLKMTVCTSREAVTNEGFFSGRVGGALQSLVFDPADTEFYLSGNPRMIEDLTKMLDTRGARYLRAERF